MKKVLRVSTAMMLSAMFALTVSCKDKETTVDESSTSTTTTMDSSTAQPSTNPDSTEVVNDSNVGGVTSGKMEQVP